MATFLSTLTLLAVLSQACALRLPSATTLSAKKAPGITPQLSTLQKAKASQEARSTSLPFLPKPTSLDGTMVGDVGFDPLGLATVDVFANSGNRRTPSEILNSYRDAELKHGRLAMLAALAWPLQERLNPLIAERWGLPDLLQETGGLSPSILNGGLEQGAVPLALFALLAGGGLVESYGAALRSKQGEDWLPGDYGFDPARIYAGLSPDKRQEMQLKELKNGRLAMVAVLAYVVQEALTQTSALNAVKALF